MQIDPNLFYSKTSNGIRYITSMNQSTHSVAISLTVMVGSGYEQEFEHGCAHLVEHISFLGNAGKSEASIADRIAALGGIINARTGTNLLEFSCIVLQDNAYEALSTMSNLFKSDDLDSDAFENEKQVVLKEMDCWGCWDEMRSLSLQAAFNDHPVTRPVIGTEDSIEDMKMHTVLNFIKKHFVGSNVIISVVGNVEHGRVKDIIETNFGFLQSGIGNDILKPTYSGGVRIDRGFCYSGHFYLGFPGPKVTDYKATELQCLASMFGSPSNSRLMLELREKRGLLYNWDVSWVEFGNETLMTIAFDIDADELKEAGRIVVEQLQSLAMDMGEQEFETHKRQLQLDEAVNHDNLLMQSENIVNDTIDFDRPLTACERLVKIGNLQLNDVKLVAQNMLESVPTFVAMGPRSKVPSLSDLGLSPGNSGSFEASGYGFLSNLRQRLAGG